MQVLKLSYEYPPIGGGGARVVAGLAEELVNLGHKVNLVTMNFHGLPKQESHDGLHVYRIPCLRLQEAICRPPEMASYLISALPFLNRLTQQVHHDINHTHFIFPDAILSLILKRNVGLPYIITAHGSDVPGYNPNRFQSLHKILKPVWIKVVNEAELVVSPSQSLMNLIKKRDPITPVTVIPNGHSINKFKVSTQEEDKILIVSRMFERKGIQYFLQALDGLEHKVFVDIVGTGPYLSYLKQISNSINTGAEIKFHGWLDNNSDLFRQLFESARIFVFPSEAENFPIVLLEAMTAGLAIITTSGTGCEEVVGDAAILVECRNPKEIRIALKRLLNDTELCKSLGKDARTRAITEFSWPTVASKYVECYERALGKVQV